MRSCSVHLPSGSLLSVTCAAPSSTIYFIQLLWFYLVSTQLTHDFYALCYYGLRSCFTCESNSMLSTLFLFPTLYLLFPLCPQLLSPPALPLPPVSFYYSPPVHLLPFSLLPCSLSCSSLCLPVDINAQARKLQRNRAKGTLTLPRSGNSSFCRSLSETSLNQVWPHTAVRIMNCHYSWN